MMQFNSAKKMRIKEVTAFSGVNFSMPESELALSAAADMANVYVDDLGRICKRTGYKKLLQSEGNVNGIFCLEYRVGNTDKKQYFIHIGTKLYMCSFTKDAITLGTCLTEEFADTKSRGFAFGGALYILGAGYYKIMWDVNFEMFVCGFVHKTETDTDKASLVVSNQEQSEAPLTGNKYSIMHAECLYKEIRYKYKQYDFEDTLKFYVVPPQLADMVRIEEMRYEKSDGTQITINPMNYTVSTDKEGLYVSVKRKDLTPKVWCTPSVWFSYNNFVYTPTNILSRRPTVLKSYYDYIVSGDSHYDGDFLEGYNLCAPHRAVEFQVTSENRGGGDGLRFCLEPPNTPGRVMRIYIDGKLVQKYVRYTNGGADEIVASDKCEFVDVHNDVLPATDCTVRVEYINTKAPKVGELKYAMQGCKVFGIFGGKNDTRVFLSGNPDFPGYDFASGLYDASYFPEAGYTIVGSDRSEIVGYHKISGYQVILKDGKNYDSTQYLRAFHLSADGETSFTVQQGAQGVAACGISTFKTCRDRMLFAGTDGVYEIRGTDVEAQTNLQYLSDSVRVRMAKEALSQAVCAVLDNRYYLAVGTQMYILDLQNNLQWYYYTDLPQIRCLYTEGDNLFFGAADGCVYRFMSSGEADAYYDNVGIGGNKNEARAIRAFWDIPVTTLGSGLYTKRIEDLCVYLAPQPKSSLSVYYTTDRIKEAFRHGESASRLDFSDWDFAKFSFVAGDYPICINTRAKAKRVRVFGARIENAEPGEGMCISGFAVRYMQMKNIK